MFLLKLLHLLPGKLKLVVVVILLTVFVDKLLVLPVKEDVILIFEDNLLFVQLGDLFG